MPRYEVTVTEELLHRLIVDAPDREAAERTARRAVIEDDASFFMSCEDRTATVRGLAKDYEETDATYDPDTDDDEDL